MPLFLKSQPPSPWRRETVPNPSTEADPSWPVLGAEVARNRFGQYIAVRQWHATPAMDEADTRTVELLLSGRGTGKPFVANHQCDPEKCLVPYTEATGDT